MTPLSVKISNPPPPASRGETAAPPLPDCCHDPGRFRRIHADGGGRVDRPQADVRQRLRARSLTPSTIYKHAILEFESLPLRQFPSDQLIVFRLGARRPRPQNPASHAPPTRTTGRIVGHAYSNRRSGGHARSDAPRVGAGPLGTDCQAGRRRQRTDQTDRPPAAAGDGSAGAGGSTEAVSSGPLKFALYSALSERTSVDSREVNGTPPAKLAATQ